MICFLSGNRGGAMFLVEQLLTGGFQKMVFKLFSNAKYHELAPEFVQAKELNFDTADVYIDLDNKKVILDTNNGKADFSFNSYDELLENIVRVAKTIYVNDMLEAFNNVVNDLTVNRRDPRLEADTGVVDNLLNEVNKARDNLFEGVYKVMMKIGYLNEEEVEKLIKDDPEIKRSVSNGIKMCWETYEDNDPDYCDHVVPVIDAVVYAIPEDRRITIVMEIDQVGDIYKIEKRYNNAYDFLKGLEEYSHKVVDP